jgi:hypothetical protein
MVSGSRQQDDLSAIIERLRAGSPELIRDVAADLGATDEARVAPTVMRFLEMIATGTGLGEAARLRLRQEGAAAVRQGLTLATLIDGYLSTAWVTWDHALRLGPVLEVSAMRALGARLLRAGDDIAAQLSEGYTTAERAVAATAGAARQAILEELLTSTASDDLIVSRLLRRAALAGLDPAQMHHVLVLRPSESDPLGDLAEELDRRLARDPVRRPYLAAARGQDLVALAPPPWRDGRPFADAVTDLTDARWWGVVAGPVALDAVATAYADAVDALRVVPAMIPARTLVAASEVALERALVADPVLATAGVDRWLAPLADAPRGGHQLVRTLSAWLDAGQSVTATSRTLGVAPRTVSYRLDRIATLLGVPTLDTEVVARLSAALLLARLLSTDRVASSS